MRSRSTPDPHLAEVTRRRLALLSREIAEARSLEPHPDRHEGTPDEGTGGRPVTEIDDPPAGHRGQTLGGDRRPRPGRHAERAVGPAGRVAGWLHDRLPPTLQGRTRLGAAQVAVVALVVGG